MLKYITNLTSGCFRSPTFYLRPVARTVNFEDAKIRYGLPEDMDILKCFTTYQNTEKAHVRYVHMNAFVPDYGKVCRGSKMGPRIRSYCNNNGDRKDNANVDSENSVGSSTKSKGSQWQSEFRVPLSEYRAVVADNGELRSQLEQAQKEELKKLYRQTIEEVEDGFPQPYDKDFNEKKVVWDKMKLKAKTGHDLKEERRRQQWLYYLKNPPNDQMQNIVAHAAKLNISIEKFAVGISKAHRFLSDDYHVRPIGTHVIIKDPKEYFIKSNIVLSLRIVLKEADILQDYIDAMKF